MVHVVSHPIQYFVPLYRAIANREEVQLQVFYYSDATLRTYRDVDFSHDVNWDSDLAWGYESRIIAGSAGRSIPRTATDGVRPDMFRAVMATDADVLWLHAYHWPTSLALAYAFLAKKRAVVLRGEQTLLHSASGARRGVKKMLMAPVVRRSRCAYIGSRNREYLQTYGAQAQNLFFTPYSVPISTANPSRDEARARLGITADLPVALFVGKLIPRKQPLLLLDAWRRASDRVRSSLVFAGDGPLRPAIEEAVRREKLENVILTGFLNQQEMPLAYSAADVFVLPSRENEPWGLVVNEALMAGLPVIVSKTVGSAKDMVRDGWNGFVVDPTDAVSMAEKLRVLLGCPEQREVWGLRGRERSSAYSIDRTVDGLVAAFVGKQRLAPAPLL